MSLRRATGPLHPAALWERLLGTRELVVGCFGKRHEPEVGVIFVVDDNSSVVESYGGSRVGPFEGDLWDEEPLGVPEDVEASGECSRRSSGPGYPYTRSPGPERHGRR